MGYFENLNKKALNLKTDGEIRYIDGGYTLVPWMESTDDEIYKNCLKFNEAPPTSAPSILV